MGVFPYPMPFSGPPMFGSFNPSKLFASNEVGGWYDPSDLTTLYQDAAGTTPVTAVEQPVGLVLDKSKGLVLGSELVTNGDFSNGTTGWSFQSNATGTVVSGELQITVSAASARGAYQDFSTVVGSTYKVTATARSSGGSISVIAYTTGFVLVEQQQLTATGTNQQFSFVFRATQTTTRVFIQQSAALSTLTIFADNISVRELPGSHLSQSTSTARPVLSARVNQLVRTEAFDNAAWTKSSVTLSSGVSDPDGGTTAWTVTSSAAGGFILQSTGLAAGITATNSIWIRRRTGTGDVLLRSPNNTTSNTLNLTSSWQRVSFTSDANNSGSLRLALQTASDAVDIWHPQVETGSTATAYQRVGAATSGSSTAAGNADYDTTNFPYYLRWDGTDDGMATGAIDFTSTDKMAVFAGVRKLSDAAIGIIAELSATTQSNAGSFYMSAPDTVAANYGIRCGGSVRPASSQLTTYTAPITNVFTGLFDIAGDSRIARINGAQVNSDTSDQGTGNFGNYPLYVASRGGSSLRFNGHIYGLVIVGRALTAAEISNMETWMNNRTKAF